MKRLTILACLFLFLSASGVFAQSDVPIMDTQELRSLLDKGPVFGYFNSVPQGAAQLRYQFRVKDIFSEGGMNIILFTTTHYIVAGMSGSPAYVRGADGVPKLIGAVAYQMNMFEPYEHWGGITPIADMMNEADKIGNPDSVYADKTFAYHDKIFKPIALGVSDVPDNLLEFAGIDAETRNFIKSNKFMVSIHNPSSAGVGRNHVPSHLKAGSPLVVDIMEFTNEKTGRVTTLGAMGTVTYVSHSGKFLAFGHPFLGARNVVYPVRTCSVTGTSLSEMNSFKIPGKASDIIATVTTDGQHGISGVTNTLAVEALPVYRVAFSDKDVLQSSFKVRIGKTPMMPVMVAMTLSFMSQVADVPLNGQTSATEFNGMLKVSGTQINMKEIFSSARFSLGPEVMYISSYQNAVQKFISHMYALLVSSPFDLAMEQMELKFNFLPGTHQDLVLGAYRFPREVAFGSTPELEISLFSRDGSVTFAKRIPVAIDWNQVEKPVYPAGTRSIDKQREKVVTGRLLIYTAQFYTQMLMDDEQQRENPSYFLDTADYLAVFQRMLTRTNARLFAKVVVQRLSGSVSEQADENLNSIVPAEGDTQDGWMVNRTRLTERPRVMPSQNAVAFDVPVPHLPDSYAMIPVSVMIDFEVVK